MQLLVEHLGHGLMLSLLLSLPAVLVAAGIGLVVGILQAVTQVQEQTIAAAPKILGVFAILLLGGGIMMTMLENYVRESFQIAFNEIPQDGKFILPPQKNQSIGQKRARAFFQAQAGNRMTDEKMKSFTGDWNLPSAEKDSATTALKMQIRPGSGNRLGVAETMMLDKQKDR